MNKELHEYFEEHALSLGYKNMSLEREPNGDYVDYRLKGQYKAFLAGVAAVLEEYKDLK